ncbi:MAG: iron-only hydrogenase system regulator [Spirochaetes bacterium]|nr:iron-only hydrogenase system regulator [Spirochaetota bacterium]
MEKRLGVVALLIQGRDQVPAVNRILSEHNTLIHGRMGLPFRDRGIQIISLIVEGTTDEINALTGPLGKLPGVQAKSVLTKYSWEDSHAGHTDPSKNENFS